MTITKGIYSGASKVIPSPNKGGAITPRLIIVHDTAGGLDPMGSVSWLCNPAARASAHFVIGREGQVYQLISCNLRGWHAGVSAYRGEPNVNNFSIGIEFVNPGEMQPHGPASSRASFGAIFDNKKYGIQQLPEQHLFPDWETDAVRRTASHPDSNWMPYTQAQLDAGLALCMDIKNTYGVIEVAAHFEISPHRKVDVNPLFPLRWLRAKVAGREDPQGAINAPPAIVPAPSRKVGLAPLGVVHEWPSFYDDNIIARTGTFDLIGEQLHNVSGEGLVNELANVQLPWYKVHCPSDTDDKRVGFILKANATLEPTT